MNEVAVVAGLAVLWWLLGIGDVYNRMHFPAFLLLSIFRILHNKMLEVKWKSLNVLDSSRPHKLYSPFNSPGLNTGVDSCSLLQGIFPIQGLNPGLTYCRWILCQLSRKESPRILEWLAYPFSRRYSRPRNQTGVFCIAGGFFTNWAIREAIHGMWSKNTNFKG